MKRIALSVFAVAALAAVIAGIYYLQTRENTIEPAKKESAAKAEKSASMKNNSKKSSAIAIDTSDLDAMGKELDEHLGQFSVDMTDIENMGADDSLADLDRDLGEVVE